MGAESCFPFHGSCRATAERRGRPLRQASRACHGTSMSETSDYIDVRRARSNSPATEGELADPN